jgi:acetyl-CoA carboxylase biotin carboxyl carrier protein
VDAGSVLVILESMKMEIPVSTDLAGDLIEVTVKEGQTIVEGQLIARVLVG